MSAGVLSELGEEARAVWDARVRSLIARATEQLAGQTRLTTELSEPGELALSDWVAFPTRVASCLGRAEALQLLDTGGGLGGCCKRSAERSSMSLFGEETSTPARADPTVPQPRSPSRPDPMPAARTTDKEDRRLDAMPDTGARSVAREGADASTCTRPVVHLRVFRRHWRYGPDIRRKAESRDQGECFRLRSSAWPRSGAVRVDVSERCRPEPKTAGSLGGFELSGVAVRLQEASGVKQVQTHPRGSDGLPFGGD